jgi:glycerophosphoryl diester phosphodiesterase
VTSFHLDRPLNFAHRGASHEAPANTLAAFQLAVELGAEGTELDVHLSKDGEVVVIHDFTVEATTDGFGSVRDLTLAELKELDAGSWFGPTFAGQRIPTLHEVIDACGRHLLLNIEIKTKVLRDDSLARAVADIIRDRQIRDRVLVSSFNPMVIWQVRQLNPGVPIGLLYAPDQPFYLRRPWLRHLVRPEALNPHHSIVDAEYVRWAKDHQYRISVWTVDEPEEMQQLIELGVDIIITNRPGVLNQLLRGD